MEDIKVGNDFIQSKRQLISDIAGPLRGTAKHNLHQSLSKTKTMVHKSTANIKPAKLKMRRGINRNLTAHKPEGSKTLMRQAVSKPKPVVNKQMRVQTAVDSNFALARLNKPAKTNRFKDLDKLERAKNINRSTLINHFRSKPQNKPSPRLASVPLKPATTSKTHEQPASSPKPSAHQAHIDNVLRSATSHTQPKVKLKRPAQLSNRIIAVVTALIAAFIIGAFIFTQGFPSMDMYVASVRAGFTAIMPSYQPTGFALDYNIKASHRKITINYRSTTDNRTFSIIQQPTVWDNTALHTYVASQNQAVQTWQDNGMTVFQYGNILTWVNHNIWYQIINNASLSTTQLQDIITGL